ncbi:transposase [Glutamicibacter protophormiae]
MNQLTLDLSTSFSPKENHVAVFIHELVEALQINDPYLFGRPREYDLGAMLKLVLFAYTRETFTSRKIERLAEENLYARKNGFRLIERSPVFVYLTMCRS